MWFWETGGGGSGGDNRALAVPLGTLPLLARYWLKSHFRIVLPAQSIRDLPMEILKLEVRSIPEHVGIFWIFGTFCWVTITLSKTHLLTTPIGI